MYRSSAGASPQDLSRRLPAPIIGNQMSTRIIGRLANERSEGLIGYRVSLRLPGSLFDYDGTEIGHLVTRAGENGHFEFTYRRDPTPPPFHRELELRVQDGVGRVLRFANELGRELLEDVDAEVWERSEDFVIREVDATGLLVTLGTGEVRNFSHGNSVTLLMDQDAFAHAAAMIDTAQKSIQMSQLFFALPAKFQEDATLETAKLIFDFHRPTGHPPDEPLDLDTHRAAGVGDSRPERLLLQAADRGVDVKILLHAFTVPLFIRLIVGALLFPFVGTDGFYVVAEELFGADLTDTDEARRYFDEARRAKIKVQPFEQSVLSAGVMHAKLMVVDGQHALSIGSPFGQSYVDTYSHRIDAWIRGDSEGLPKHDAGFGVSGPAVLDLYRAFRLLWNTAAPDDKLPEQPELGDPLPTEDETQPQLRPAEAVCSMQIVRTLSAGEPLNLGDGEKGILEAYLRAIAAAEDFIYLETQYFTNDAIGHALVEAMKRKAKLQVIVLLNIEPDVPTYPFKQRRLITRIREGIGQKADGPQRFGVFTRWAHEIGTPRPRILPVYIHAKVGIVDNTWATVGSANLDGLSLDSSLPSDIFRDLFNMQEQRAIEVNAILQNGDDRSKQVVDILRRKLWAEHLGYFTARDVLNIDADDLKNRPTGGGWLQRWSERAAATLKQLVEQPSLPITGMATVLPWPKDDTTYKTPRKHLDALKIRSHAVVPLKSTRAFDFETGEWKEDSKPKMDYP